MHANSKGRWFLLLCWLGAALAVRRGPELGPYGIELNITADDDVPLTVHTPLDPFISNDGQYFFNASNYREPYMTKEHVERFITNLMFPTVMSVALDGSSNWLTTYAALPDLIASDEVLWHLDRLNRDADQEIDFRDTMHWMVFIVEFIEWWREVDWIPTFDMVLIEHLVPRKKFKGLLTEGPGEG